MTKTLENILQLNVAERLELVEYLWDSIVQDAADLPLTVAQRKELDRRLRDESQPTSSWNEVKKRLQSK